MISRFLRFGRLAFVLACVIALCAGEAQAQDPRATAAQAAARSWLVLTDAGDVKGSLKAGGKKFREALDAEAWDEALKKVRGPLGTVMSRAVLATKFQDTMPGGPSGEYALILFETNFSDMGTGHETVTLEREPDGAWRVIGYFIR